jgi:DNA repair exonuclease SbcCD nuclease subunit
MFNFRKREVAIFSDIHLGVHHNSKFWHDTSLEWAKWYIDDINKKGIEDIVFCGDFFHTRDEVSVDTLHFGSKLLELFKDFNLIMIVGNHDCFLKDSSEVNSISPYSNWKNITVVDKPLSIESFGKNINFIPWGIKLDDIPNSDITFGHFEINLFKMNTYALCDDGFVAEDLLKKSNLIISGHFHLMDDRKYSDGRIVYVGNPFQMDFNDSGTTKGYYTLDIQSGEMFFTENKTSPKHFNISLSYLLTEKTLTDKVKEKFKDNLIKLKIDRRISPDDMEFLINVLKGLKPINLNVEYETEISDYGLNESELDLSGIDIEQAIIEFIDTLESNNKKDLIQYTIELYNRLSK